MEFGAPSEILPVEVTFKFPYVYLLDFNYFEALASSLLIIFGFFFFKYLFRPKKGQVFSSTALNLMKEHSRPCCVTLLLKDCYHKVDGPHHGLKIYTSPQSGRTPPWVKNLYKSSKWTDPTRTKLIQIQKVNGPSRDLTYAKKGDGPYRRSIPR